MDSKEKETKCQKNSGVDYLFPISEYAKQLDLPVRDRYLQDILKEQCPRGLLAKNEHFGASCLRDRSPVILRKLHTNPPNLFLGGPKKNLEGFVWSFASITGLRSQRQFAPKCSFLAICPFLDIVLSEYPDKSHNFGNFIFMTSHFSTLFAPILTPIRAFFFFTCLLARLNRALLARILGFPCTESIQSQLFCFLPFTFMNKKITNEHDFFKENSWILSLQLSPWARINQWLNLRYQH